MVKPREVRAFPCHQSSTSKIFKYNNELYQSVQNFCDNYDGLRKGSARKAVVNTKFPNSACLVIPGKSANNYKWIRDDWKNGHQELSQVEDAAYLLDQGEKPAGKCLLLVSRDALKKSAVSALESLPRKAAAREPTKKSASSRSKAKAKPILPIVADDASKDHDDQQNPFSTRHMGLCPTCRTATDISKLSVDPRGRSRCPQQGCKAQTLFLHWDCLKCSGRGRRRQSFRGAQPVNNYFHLDQTSYCSYLLLSISKCGKSINDLAIVISDPKKILLSTCLQRF